MAILSKKDIKKYLAEDRLSFEPALDQFQIQPNSIDLRAGWNFYVPQQWQYTEEGRIVTKPDYLTKKVNEENFKMLKLRPGQYFEFLPNEFVIISSLEKVNFKADDLMALLYPRSSMIRRGFVIESGVIDVRYKGQLTIPVFNATTHPLRLYPGERLCQLVFHTVENGLTEEDAQTHGVAKAKYHDSNAQNLEARTDSEEELEFIKKGSLKDIKEKYKVDLG